MLLGSCSGPYGPNKRDDEVFLSLATPTVLIAADEPQICEMLSLWVEEGGWQSVTAPDGDAALDVLRGGDVDVALIDLMMPGKDGLEILAHARAEDIKTELVMISGHGTVPIAVQAIKQGAHDFVEKPFGKADVVSMLRDLLASRHPAGQNLVTRLDQYVMDHATSPSFRLGDVCDRFRISARYVSKLFKAHFGETFRSRLLAYRISHAKRQMEQTDDPLYMIAERSGFRDYRALTAALKRVEGITPRRYRQTVDRPGH